MRVVFPTWLTGSQASMVKGSCPCISFGSLFPHLILHIFQKSWSFTEHEYEGELGLKFLADKETSSGFLQGQSPQQHQKGEILLLWGYGGKV